MIEYVRAELIKRLSFRLHAMKYTDQFEKKYHVIQERRQVERLLRAPRKAASLLTMGGQL